MACYDPVTAYRVLEANPKTGKRGVTLNPRGTEGERVTFGCYTCIGCKEDRARQWAIRIWHESQLYEENCFITLTYSPENVPAFGSLELGDWQKFMKRLREHVRYYDRKAKRLPRKIRVYDCGEYGEKRGRPHFHAILFNYDFPDKVFEVTRGDSRLYTSPTLSKLWPFGFSSIGDVSFQSAGYVARYVLKKQYGPDSEVFYEKMDPDTGEIVSIKKEFATMSKGIGRGWVDRYSERLLSRDTVVKDGKEVKPPRYYDRVLEVDNAERFEEIRSARLAKSRLGRADQTRERLLVREECHYARAKLLKRSFESGT